jgi:hypothetical protein
MASKWDLPRLVSDDITSNRPLPPAPRRPHLQSAYHWYLKLKASRAAINKYFLVSSVIADKQLTPALTAPESAKF